MDISTLGEFGLIERFAPDGVGDDCAVIPMDRSRALLVTTDMLVEDIHFLRANISSRDLGYKALSVNLSDIAAMGGFPTHAFLSIALPISTEVEWVEGFFGGLKELGDRFGVKLSGGDTTRSPERIVVNIAVLGEAESSKIKYRSQAKSGDALVVTGHLGDSSGGLKAILGGDSHEAPALVKAHLRPEPHLLEGQWMASQEAVGAMMDVSDGIGSDLLRIIQASGCGVRVDLDRLPISGALKIFAKKRRWNVQELAIGGGEDYCLLASVRKDSLADIRSRYSEVFGRELYVIGEITSQSGEVTYLSQGREVDWKITGFDHFKGQNNGPKN